MCFPAWILNLGIRLSKGNATIFIYLYIYKNFITAQKLLQDQDFVATLCERSREPQAAHATSNDDEIQILRIQRDASVSPLSKLFEAPNHAQVACSKQIQ